MDKLVIREVRPGDVERLVEELRISDIRECRAALGAHWRQCLIEYIPQSRLLTTAIYGGRFGSMQGVTPVEGGGVPWMLATTAVDRHPAMLELGLELVPKYLKRFQTLVNYVDNRNHRAIRWLKRIGFEVGEPEPHGATGHLFRRFHACATQ